MPAHIDRSVCGPQVKGSQEDSSKTKEALFFRSLVMPDLIEATTKPKGPCIKWQRRRGER